MTNKFKVGDMVMIASLGERSPISVITKLPRNLKIKNYITKEAAEVIKTKLYYFTNKDVVGYGIDERDMVLVSKFN